MGIGLMHVSSEFTQPRFQKSCRAQEWASRRFVLAVGVALLSGTVVYAQVPLKHNVLILNEAGLTHPLTATMTHDIVSELHDRNVEFYTESLDLLSSQEQPSPAEVRDWLTRKYIDYKLDAIIAVGPYAVNFLADSSQTPLFRVPIVICGSSAIQAGNPRLGPQFTGTWVKLEPAKSIEAALRLFPDTRRVVVVGGASPFDKVAVSATKEALSLLPTRLDVSYLTGMEMGKLLDQLRHQPEHSIVLYLSIFQDAAGNNFLNAASALPMVTAASNAPVFGMSDTYLGHGVVGGSVMRFHEQAAVTARIVSRLLDGDKPEDIPIQVLPSEYMFDWKELQRWHISERSLPQGSIVLFRQPSVWERTKWIWTISLVVILGLSALIVYLLFSRKQLQFAREKQRQLSGMLITAEEAERSHIAMELHDDFSQRLAVLAFGLETAAEAIPDSPQEAERQLHNLLNSASEIGADLHTLSHQLHSSTLERLGLVSGVGAICKEFQAKQGIHVDFRSEDMTRDIAPDAALCVFRIVQESLRNLKKHSGTSRARVSLIRTSSSIHVTVSDDGIGFDPKKLSCSSGLGIRSMEERARFLGGRFEIRSEPGKGTDAEAWVPCQPKPT